MMSKSHLAVLSLQKHTNKSSKHMLFRGTKKINKKVAVLAQLNEFCYDYRTEIITLLEKKSNLTYSK